MIGKWLTRLRRAWRSRDASDEAQYAALVRDVATAMGHKPSGLAGAGGGDHCTCGRASWSHLPEYDAGGGCPAGWARARRALETHHRFSHRNDLLRVGDAGVLCRRYGCDDADVDEWWKVFR